jgi:hypothetical protein
MKEQTNSLGINRMRDARKSPRVKDLPDDEAARQEPRRELETAVVPLGKP